MAPGSPRSPSGRDRLLDLEPLVPREHGERRATTHEAGTLFDLWRSRHWTPALRAAGVPHRGPYAIRQTFASWAIAAGLPTFGIAATMGTSLEQLSKTYAHLLPDSADRARVALDAYINQAAEAAERACDERDSRRPGALHLA